MNLGVMGLDSTIMDTLHELLDFPNKLSHHAPSRAYVQDAKAMSATPADVKECPESYVFVIDMPSLKPDQIKVQVEDNMLVVSGDRREREKDQGVKYVRMERRLGKYLKKFMLPEGCKPREDIGALSGRGVDGDVAEEAEAGTQEAEDR